MPFLLGEITEQQLHEQMQEQRTGSEDNVSRQVVIFIAMKKYAGGGPAAVIPVLEKYMEEWGNDPPPWGRPDFIKRHWVVSARS